VDTLNVRAGPGLVYPTIGQLKRGQVIGVIGQSKSPVWWQVALAPVGSLPKSGVGWVSGELVEANDLARKSPVVTDLPPTPVLPSPTPATVATKSPAAGACPSWYQRPEPGKGVLLIENHDTMHGPGAMIEEVNVPGQWWIPPKQNDVPGRMSLQLSPGTHTIIVEIPTHGRRLISIDVQPGVSYVSPITRDVDLRGIVSGPGVRPSNPRVTSGHAVYVMQPPPGCAP
jgi:uncharacterized protein YraI